MTQQEHDYDTNQHSRQIDFVSAGAVPVASDVGIPHKKRSFMISVSNKISTYLIPLKMAVLK